MVIFHSYVKLPEGNRQVRHNYKFMLKFNLQRAVAKHGGNKIEYAQNFDCVQMDESTWKLKSETLRNDTVHLKPVASFLFKWKNSFRTLEATRWWFYFDWSNIFTARNGTTVVLSILKVQSRSELPSMFSWFLPLPEVPYLTRLTIPPSAN